MHPDERRVRALAPEALYPVPDFRFPIPPSPQPQFSFRIPGAYKPDAYAVKEQEAIIKK
jgi:hypothetical protein